MRTSAADLAAIDAVTFELLTRHHPDEVAGLRVLGFTAQTPGLPLITAARVGAEGLARLRRAIHAAVADETLSGARSDLLLDGFEVLPTGAYDMIPAMHHAAVAAGYSELA